MPPPVSSWKCATALWRTSWFAYRTKTALPGSPRYRVSTMARPVSATDWDNPTAAVAAETATRPTLDQVRNIVGRFVPVAATVSDLRWSSVFYISHRIVPHYRVGRVFLAGDAATFTRPLAGRA